MKEERRINIVVKYPLMGSLEEWEDSFTTCKDEVDLYKSLQTWKCPYLLRFYGTHGPGLVFEEVDGESLSDLVDTSVDVSKHMWNWSQLGEHVATALLYLHKLDISHNDLKPENVRFSKSKGIWKLLDLGLATEMDCKVVRSIGTDGFRAPEVAAKGRLHVKSDVYGMGIMMQDALVSWSMRYELAFNQLVKKEVSSGYYCGKRKTKTKEEELQAVYLELEDDMKELVDRMIETDPDKRPSILALVHEFRSLQERENKLVDDIKKLQE
jgi:serine/threonine protein kinase